MNNYCCNKIDDYFDDELSADELARFNESVAECAECQRLLEQQTRLDSQLRSAWRETQTPAGLEGVVAEVDSQPTPVPSSATPTTRGASVALALLVVVAIVAVILVRPGSNIQSPSGDDSIGQTTDGDPTPKEIVSADDEPAVVVEFNGQSIGVVDEISDSEFTLVRVYPTISLSSNSANNSTNNTPNSGDSR